MLLFLRGICVGEGWTDAEGVTAGGNHSWMGDDRGQVVLRAVFKALQTRGI